MREVRKVGLPGLEKVNGGEGLSDGHVGLVGLVAEGIDDEDVEIMKEFEGLFGDDFDIGEVGNRSDGRMVEAVSVGADRSVPNFDGGDLERVEREGGFDFAGLGADVAGLVVFVRKGPGMHAGEAGEGFGRAVKRERLFASPAEGSEFIEAGDMVEMFVGIEDGVDGGEFLTESLLAEVGSTVDEELAPWAIEKDGGA